MDEGRQPTEIGLRAAVSLTYDGGDVSHLEVAHPTLSELGLTGSFFLASERLLQRALAWQSVSNEGHEIGAHPLWKVTDGRGNLGNWTLDMVEDELRSARRLLTEFFPHQADFPFAYPGFETLAVLAPYDRTPTSYREVVRRVFEVARTPVGGLNGQATADLGWLFSVPAEHLRGEDLIALATQAASQRSWLIIRFEGVGVGESGVDVRDHREFCLWLSEHRDDLPTVSLGRHAARLRAARESLGQTFTLRLE